MGSQIVTILLWRKLLLLFFFTQYTTGSLHGIKQGSLKGKEELFDFHPDYWLRLDQAIKYAKCVEHEVPPILDDLSLIVKPAYCRKETKANPACEKCVQESNIVDLNVTTYASQHVQFQHYANAPMPLFHCTSHVGSSQSNFQQDYKTHFRMEYPTIHPPLISNEDLPRVFVVEMEVDGKWETAIIQLFWLFPLETKSHSTYRIRVTAVSPKNVYYPQLSEPITLFDTRTQIIGKPKNFRVVDTQIDRTAARPGPLMTLRWESGSGTNASCDYDVFYMDDEEYKVERIKPEEAFWVVLDKIGFDRDYNIHLMERFGFGRESSRSDLHVTIMSCLELQNFSFDACPPPEPSGIRVEDETPYSFRIVWDRFKEQNDTNQISSFDVMVEKLPSSTDVNAMYKVPQVIFHKQIPGDQHFVEFNNNDTLKGPIRISIVARSNGGKSHEGTIVYHLRGDSSWTKHFEKFWVIILILVLVLTAVAVIIYLKSFRDRINRNRKKKEKWKKWDEEVRTPHTIEQYCSKWEIDFGNLVLHHVVGRGQFGEVRKATLRDSRGRKTTVAVKTLRVPPPDVGDNDFEDGTSSPDIIKTFFREEYEILKGIAPHKHVVGLVGVLKSPIPALVVEFCDGGDLQSHLRKSSPAKFERKPVEPIPTIPTTSAMNCIARLQQNASVKVQLSMVTNEAYFMSNDTEPRQLTNLDLLSYARQIACGMEFLSSNKIIHRDLAARNILISGPGPLTLKIADFGLSRDVYEQNWYKKRSAGKIPIKWLAIECLTKEVYTTKSDVWSFAIVLWEIVTFGAIPYPGVDNHRLYDVLKEGYRMTQPEDCSDDLYFLMQNCWNEDSHSRPDFTTIRKRIEDLIGNGEAAYLNLKNVDSSSSGTVQYAELQTLPVSL